MICAFSPARSAGSHRAHEAFDIRIFLENFFGFLLMALHLRERDAVGAVRVAVGEVRAAQRRPGVAAFGLNALAHVLIEQFDCSSGCPVDAGCMLLAELH